MKKHALKIVCISALLAATGILLSASLPQVPSGTWVAVGSMNSTRAGASTVLLQDGRILITGGSDANGPSSAAEFFGANGSFSAAAPMNVQRSGHISVVLQDGRVLVAGGTTNGGGVTNSAEMFDPTANSWTNVTGGMMEARSGETATLLSDGRVLIAGGSGSGATISMTAEIFDPASQSFALAGVLSSARFNHAAALLEDGRVLIVGGSDGSKALATSDIFDPVAGTISAGPKLATARQSLSATTLLDGRVLIAGGNNVVVNPDGTSSTVDLASAEILDAGATAFSNAASALVTARSGQQAFLLPHNNSVLIVGGASNGTAIASSELYIPWGNSQAGIFQATGSMATPRASATGAALQQDGLLLVAGGKDAGGTPLSSSELYGFATVKTDAADYPPGTTVNITGSGWQPGEAVTLTLVESPLIDTHGPYTVTADANGNISDSSFTTDVHDVNVKFALTAVGAVSQAQTTFTDSIRYTSLTVGTQTGTLTYGNGASATYSVAAGYTGGGTVLNDPVSLTFVGWTVTPTGVSTSFSPTSVTNGSPTSTLTITTSASTQAGTYTFTVKGTNTLPTSFTGTGTLTVGTRAITVTAATNSKQYDGTLSATAIPTITTGTLAAGDTASFTEAYSTKNVGTGNKTLIPSGSVSDGHGGVNYTVTFVNNTTGTISARPLTVTAAANTKTYDGTTSAAATPSITSGAIQTGDTAAFTETYDTKNVGNGKTLTPSGTVTDGNGGANYTYTFATNTTGVISARAITVTAAASSKIYDATTGSTAVSTITSGSLASGDTATWSETYDNKNVGTTHVMTPAGTVSDGNSGSNYVVTFVTINTGVITARAITVTAAASSKSYDGTTSSSGVPTITSGGLASGDTATWSETYDNKNVGTTHVMTPTGTVSDGNSGSNYAVTFATINTGVITARALTVTAATNTKTYDGTISAAASPAVTTGTIQTGDTANFTETYSNKNAGVGNKTLIPAGTVSDGNSGNNYTYSFVNFTTGTINTEALTVTAATNTKTYDATPSAAATPTITSGAVQTGDTANFTETYNTANAGTGKILTPAGTVTDGNAGNNYSYTFITNSTGVINKATPAFSNLSSPSITYGTLSTTLSGKIATGSLFPTGSVSISFDSLGPQSPAISGADGTFSSSFNTSSLAVSGSPYTITYSYAGDANFLSASDTTKTVTVTQASTTTSMTSSANPASFGQTINFTVTVAPQIGGVPTGTAQIKMGNTIVGTGTLSGGQVTIPISTLAVGTSGLKAFYLGDTNFSASQTQNALSQVVNRASTTTAVTLSASTITFGQSTTVTAVVSPQFTGTPSGSVTVTDGLGGTGDSCTITLASGTGSCTLTPSAAAPGGLTVTASYPGDTNFTSSSGTTTLTVNKANATIVVTPYNVTYDAAAHTATATATGVGSVNLFADLDLTHTTHTSAGTYTADYWTFTDPTGNYNNVSNTIITDTISKANATISVTPYTVTYDATAHTATATATGVGGANLFADLDLTHTTHTSAGTYTTDYWTFTDPNGNYNNVTNTVITDTISKANATISVTPYSFTYDGNSHMATGTATGVGSVDLSAGLTLTGTAHTSAGDYPNDPWSFAGGTNYNDANGTVHDSIAKATALIAVIPYSATYDGSPHTATGSAKGVGGADLSAGLTLTGTTHTSAGDYPSDPWSFAGGTNYNDAAGTVHDVINEATTRTAVVSSANPSTVGGSVSFIATVTSAGGTPTGSVQFVIDSANFAAAASLSSGSATSSAITTLSPGEHTITAIYISDGNFLASTSPFLLQEVNNPLASIAVTPANPTIVVADTQQFVATGTFADGSSAILPTGGTWALGNSITHGVRAPMAAAGSNGTLYYFGGQDTGGAENFVQTYNPASGVWGNGTAMPTPRYMGTAVAPGDGKVYVIGGWNGPVPTSVVEAYDPAGNSWASKAGMTHLSGCSVSGVINGKIYVMTGCNGFSGYYGLLDVYDPASNSWTSLPAAPNAHANGAGGVINGKLYVVGGYSSIGPASATLDVYDPQSNSWSSMAAMPAALTELSGGFANGKLHVVGGTDGTPTNRQSSVYVYDPVANTWSTGPSLSQARMDIGLTAFDGLLYAAGGYTSSTSNLLEILDTDKVTWASATTSVATIDANTGIATGETPGTANISATSSVTSVSGSTVLTVIRKDQTITFGALGNKTYGDPDFAVSATASSGLAVSFVAVGNCTVTSDGSAVHIAAAGSCTITARQAGNNIYNAAPDAPQTFTTNKAHLIVTADNKSKTYDGAVFSPFTATLSGFVNNETDAGLRSSSALSGSAGFTGAATTAVNASATPYTITPTAGSLSATNYDFTLFNGGTLTINARLITVTADPQTKVYGSSDPALTYKITGGSLVSTDAFTGALTRDAGETVSTYAILQGTLAISSNYNLTYVGANMAITPAPLTIAANPQTKVYGQPDPALTFASTGFQFSDTAASVLTGALSRTAGEAVAGSPYAIGQGSLVANSNYTIHFTGSALSITPAPLTITANPQTKQYGSVDPTLTYASSGFRFSDTVATALTGSLTRVSGEAVASSPYTIGQGSLVANSNYTIHFTGSNLTITPAPLTITANPQTKVYGQSDPALTFASSGFQFSDTVGTVLTGALSRTAGETVAGSPYTIGLGSLVANSNYMIHFTGSVLSITPALLTITANPQTKQYGLVDPTLTYASSGFQFSDTAASVFTGALSRAAGETVAGSPYAIGQGSLVANSNYTIHFTSSTLTITPAPLTITANPRTKQYGQPDPVLTFASSGFQFSDTAATVLTGALSRTAGEAVAGSPYAIGQGSLVANSNYTILFTGNTLSITPAPLTITANPQTKQYGSADPTLTYGSSGFQFSDTAATVLTGALSRTVGEAVAGSPYAIGQGSLVANSNYTILFTGSTLSITPAPLTITASPQTKQYGSVDPTLTYGSSGFQFSDTAASVLTGVLSRTAGEAVAGSPYAIGQGSLVANSNYTIHFTGSALSITPAPLTITASPQTKQYGSVDPTLTYASSGFQFSDTAATVLTGALSRTAGEAVVGSPYAIGQGSLVANSNYTILFTGNTLSITPAPLTINANPQTKMYGQPDPALTFASSGFQFSDTAASVLTGALSRTAGETVAHSPYAIGQGTLTANSNYTILFTGSTLTITPANTTTSVTMSTPNPSVYDQPITISALVANASTSATVNEGMVVFTADAMTPLCTTGTVLGGTASCTTGPLTLSVGAHTIIATYVPGTDFFASGSASVPQVVNARHTSVTITSSEISNFAIGSVPIDSTVHLQVTVTDDDLHGTPVTPIGTFSITSLIASDTFSPNDGSGNGLCALSGSGASAACALTVTPVEADLHELTANYPGDSVHLASTQSADMTVTAPLVSQKICLDAPFNGTPIPAGSTVWFNAVFQTTGQKITTMTHLTFYKQTIQIGSGTPMPVPDGAVTFDPNAAFASTTFDAVDNRWNTILPTYNLSAKNWLSGMPVQLPAGLPGSTAPITWCGQFASDNASLQLGWQWAAAVYSNNSNFVRFDPNNPTDLNAIGVKAVDDNKADVNYKNSDHAGTPENFLKFVIGGARGGGGNNFTGGYSGSGNVK